MSVFMHNPSKKFGELKVSIIIPVYNAEKYIKRTVQSVLTQNYQNIEIILVDDFSTDSSLKVCRELQALDKRIIIIENGKNGGSGYSKNVGLEHMVGNAFCFVDDDDLFVNDEIISKCVDTILNTQADIVCFGYCDDAPELNHYHYVFQNSYEMSGKKAVAKLLQCNELDSNPWCKLYTNHVYEGIRFPIGMVYDDANVTYKVFMNAKKVVNTGILGYSHTSRMHSISGGVYKEHDWDYIVNVQKTNLDLQNESEDLKNGAQIMLSRASVDLLMKYGRGGKMSHEKYSYLKTQYDKNYELLIGQSQSRKERIIMSMIHYNMISIVRAYYRMKYYI